MNHIGVALAGGRSRRMGRDKALLRLTAADAGETLVESAVRRLRDVCATVVVADRGRHLVDGFASIADADGVEGPAAGILGAAAVHPGATLVVLACDLPQVPPALLAALADLDGDWAVPRWEQGIEPLCGVYRPPALAALAALARQGQFALHALFDDDRLATAILEGAALRAFGPPADVFRNLNRPEDLANPPPTPPLPWGEGAGG